MKENCILNIGAGKLKPLGIKEFKNYFLINLDTLYINYTSKSEVDYAVEEYLKGKSGIFEYYINDNIFEFLNEWIKQFDLITMYRFLEHVKRDQILYLIYLLSTVTKPFAEIEVIVPNYVSLANRIINEDPFHKDFIKEDIITSTELFNEPEMPHCSIWTPKRAEYYFQLEGRFEITSMHEKFEFDNRDIYMRFIATRI